MWTQTYSGKAFEYNNIQPDMLDIRDIAHALALQNRYNGHTKYPYSVALHSVLCSYAPDCPNELRFEALMHDAAEAYLGDIPRPFTRLIPEIKTYFREAELAIANKYGTRYPMSPEVKAVDDRLLMTEKQYLLGPEPREWICTAEPYPDVHEVAHALIHSLLCVGVAWDVAEGLFLQRYKELAHLGNGVLDIEDAEEE